MVTQISFTADKSLKDKAMAKAKKKGVTLKSVLVFSMQAFADGKIDLGIIPAENDVVEMHFEDSGIKEKAKKLANLLK